MLNNKNFFDKTTQSRNPPSHVNLISVRLKQAGSDSIPITKARNFFQLSKFFRVFYAHKPISPSFCCHKDVNENTEIPNVLF